ncbi:MAG TPA: hypothetical protein EYH06_03995 [Chromatiales bacterium]|nr:hypothetical protein [Thiotrichales bacterium]HIP67735.1 hypothetical protein [Chromatiales bacterium]
MGFQRTLLLLSISLLPTLAQAIQVQIGFTNPFVYIQVGHGQFSALGLWGPPQGQIDEITFNFPVGVQPGDGTPVNGTPVNIPVAVLAYSGGGRANFRVTMDTSTPLINGAGNTLQFSEFSWTTRDGHLSAGRFNNSPNQLWQQFNFNYPRGRGVIDFLTFRYDNDQVYRPGTYTGRITYTITEL